MRPAVADVGGTPEIVGATFIELVAAVATATENGFNVAVLVPSVTEIEMFE